MQTLTGICLQVCALEHSRERRPRSLSSSRSFSTGCLKTIGAHWYLRLQACGTAVGKGAGRLHWLHVQNLWSIGLRKSSNGNSCWLVEWLVTVCTEIKLHLPLSLKKLLNNVASALLFPCPSVATNSYPRCGVHQQKSLP